MLSKESWLTKQSRSRSRISYRRKKRKIWKSKLLPLNKLKLNTNQIRQSPLARKTSKMRNLRKTSKKSTRSKTSKIRKKHKIRKSSKIRKKSTTSKARKNRSNRWNTHLTRKKREKIKGNRRFMKRTSKI